MASKTLHLMYPDRNPMELEPYYSLHVAALTREDLHLKSAIAEQLAWRDQKIAALTKQLQDLPERFSTSEFHRAGLSLHDSVTALMISRRILEDAERAAESI